MNLEDLSHAEVLHHAYIVVGDEHSSQRVLEVLQSKGVLVSGTADVVVHHFTDMTVDDVRDTLQPFAYFKSLSGAKYVVASFASANTQAQNALLKIVEEAPGDTHFFFCVESLGYILPTLRSRCIALSGPVTHAKDSDSRLEAKEFLSASYPDRLSMVDKISATLSKTQERAPVRELVRSLLEELAESGNRTVLRDLIDADGYLRLAGSSAKSILGHLAVVIPRK